MRAYQGNQMGRIGGDNCLLELLPLPSPSVRQWPYASCSAIPGLQERGRYVEHVAPQRIAHLRSRILEYRPRAVVFYNRNYQRYWEQISGGPFDGPTGPGVQLRDGGDMLFALTANPTYRGLTSQYFADVGAVLGKRLGN